MMADMDNEKLVQLSQELQTAPTNHNPYDGPTFPKRTENSARWAFPPAETKSFKQALPSSWKPSMNPSFANARMAFDPDTAPSQPCAMSQRAYRAGATWIIEGDITDCFGSIPHGVILNCLRKRIKDERFIDLIRKMLQAGVMEAGRFTPTYSGTPQGGIASPILANIVLHELDAGWKNKWEPIHRRKQPQNETHAATRNTCALHYRIMDFRRYLDGKRPLPKNAPRGTAPRTAGEAANTQIATALSASQSNLLHTLC